MEEEIKISCDECKSEEKLCFSRDAGARSRLPNLEQQDGNRRQMRQISEKSEDIHPLKMKKIVISLKLGKRGDVT